MEKDGEQRKSEEAKEDSLHLLATDLGIDCMKKEKKDDIPL